MRDERALEEEYSEMSGNRRVKKDGAVSDDRCMEKDSGMNEDRRVNKDGGMSDDRGAFELGVIGAWTAYPYDNLKLLVDYTRKMTYEVDDLMTGPMYTEDWKDKATMLVASSERFLEENQWNYSKYPEAIQRTRELLIHLEKIAPQYVRLNKIGGYLLWWLDFESLLRDVKEGRLRLYCKGLRLGTKKPRKHAKVLDMLEGSILLAHRDNIVWLLEAEDLA